MDYKYLSERFSPCDPQPRGPGKDTARNLPKGRWSRAMRPATGYVHLGNIVQKTSERVCHQSGGVMYLRIEDTDSKRESGRCRH